MIIPGLREIHGRWGYLPKEELELLALRLREHLYRIYEVASYFPAFRLEPPHGVEIHICRDMSCHLRGAEGLLRGAAGQFAANGEVQVEGVSCLGRCDRAPVVHVVRHESRQRRWVKVLDRLYASEDLEQIQVILGSVVAGTPPAALPLEDLATPRESGRPAGAGWRIDVYDREVDPEAPRRYEAVRRFERGDLTPDAVIGNLEEAELEGLGGAAARASNKWKSVREQQGGPKYVVCNGDESEPGTFKDRELMLRTPHLIIEGVILALRYLGAEEGYIYVRHEYHAQIEALRGALRDAEEIFLAETFGGKFPFRIEVVESPGGYICGEQSALLEALEGRRAQPRLQNSPLAIQANGLRGKPTILNNAETMAWVPSIILKGGAWFARQGFANRGPDGGDQPIRPDRYKGRRFFSISGDVTRPGVYEIPIGIPLRELVAGGEYARGMRDGQGLRAIAPSGPSGGFLPAELDAADLRRRLEAGLGSARDKDQARIGRFLQGLPGAGPVSTLDLELASPLFRAMGTMLGAGIVVYGSTRDMVKAARNAVEFFRNESCGKCVPCRLGTQQLARLAGRLDEGRYCATAWRDEGAAALVEGLARAMDVTSICSLGRVASNPLATLLDHFPADVEGRRAGCHPPAGGHPGGSS